MPPLRIDRGGSRECAAAVGGTQRPDQRTRPQLALATARRFFDVPILIGEQHAAIRHYRRVGGAAVGQLASRQRCERRGERGGSVDGSVDDGFIDLADAIESAAVRAGRRINGDPRPIDKSSNDRALLPRLAPIGRGVKVQLTPFLSAKDAFLK